MSSNLVSNVTITGNLLVQGSYSNVASLNTGALSTTFLVQGSTTAVSTFKIAGGRYHTAVILADGTVRTFGRNDFGQLGVNDNTQRLTPVQVFGISSSAMAVSCGQYLTSILLENGTVRTFGNNTYGQLGVNDTVSRQTPVQVFGISSSAVAVACGLVHTAVLLGDGTVRTFGRNQYGELGVNDTTQRQTPVTVVNISTAMAIACGADHTTVLLTDGTVRTFGRNNQGQLGVNDNATRQTPVQVFGISSSATAVACGFFLNTVLLADGTVRTFGRNDEGQLGINVTSGTRQTPVTVLNISTATAVTAGYFYTAVLLADRTVRTFGSNDQGQLGINVSGGTRQTPVQVFGISSSAVAVGGGAYQTVVLLADGSVRTFGRNNFGQLGVGDTASRLTPVQVVSGITSVLGRVAGGRYHTAVVMGDGTVRTFGRNDYGQLGVNDTTTRLTPVQVFGISSSATAVSCGYYHTTVLLADGTVRTFGSNGSGQLGIDVSGGTRQTPVTVLNISTATAISCGQNHTAVLLADGTVRTFGKNSSGNLGVNDTTTRQTPVQVFGISSSAIAVSCGSYFTAVLLADGTVRTFGQNNNGQLGVGDTTQRNTPVQVSGITSGTAMASGFRYAAVLLADGSIRTFGNNSYGQLGVNDTTQRNTPVTVLNITSATAVAAGTYHAIVLLADGTVRAFGRNNAGQLGVGDLTQRPTPVQVFGISSSATAIAAGSVAYHTVILLADGSVRTFGQNTFGQLGVADTVNRLIPVKVGVSGNKVAGGNGHTAVVSNDGTVRTVGDNSTGQLGVNDTTQRLTPVQVTVFTSATAVACGYYHTVVLLGDGTVRAFGSNVLGALGINVAGGTRQTPVQVFGISSSAVAVACGRLHTAVLLADGTVRTFGYNGQGALGVNDTTDRSTPVQVFGISSSATAIACGQFYTVVLLADGTVRTFGAGGSGQLGLNDTTNRPTPVQVFGISSSAVAIAGGYYQTVVLLADGTVRTFGKNVNGELGINVNDGTTRQTPVQVFGISSSAVAVACGNFHTIVLLADGTVRTFGDNAQGQLGINVNTGTRQTPVQVFGISSSATAIACGFNHTALLLQDGTVRTFGQNGSGQLGVNDTTSRLTPVQVLAGAAVVAPFQGRVAGGQYHTAVVMADGTVRTFGKNNNGQLGLNDTTQRLTPVQVFGISSSATAVAIFSYHTAVLLADGTVRAFGDNTYGQLGIDVSGGTRQTPVTVLNISTATAIGCGYFGIAALLSDGTVRTVGGNAAGVLGINVNGGSRQTPVQVFGISSSATAVACGFAHTAVILADGTVRMFGNNGFGQLGINDLTNRFTPVQVFGISSSATAVACGTQHTAVILADGTVRTFGLNTSGQLGVGDTTQRETPVQITGITSATAVACSRYRTSVLLSNGTVRMFGQNNFGQLGVNDTTNRNTPVQVFGISSSATAVGCGIYHTIVLLADGTVRTFGYNNQGQLGDNTSVDKSTPVTVLNITTAFTGVAATFITNATAIVIALSSASTPVVTGFLLSTAAIITYPFIQFPALNLGPVTYPQYQLELTTDYARKLTTSTWTIGSDERLKTDIETANVDRCVEIVQNLDLKRFAWNFPDGSQPPDSHSLGWIAQEFAQFFPRSVEEAPAHGIMDFKNLNSDQIIKVMWGALKKLRADLKSQKSSDSELSTAGDNASPTPE